MTVEDTQVFIEQLAEQLGETDDLPRKQLTDIVKHCGVVFAQDILRQTLETEAAGGLMLPDNSRRRTLGGVFFYYARRQMPKELRARIYPKAAKETKAPFTPELPIFHWENRLEVLRPLLDEQGEISTVKVTLIGRPGKIDQRKDVVVTTMSHGGKFPTLPKGLPVPPETPTLYTVYIAAKQWRKIEEAIADPEDALIVEGTCALDPEVGGIAVFALSVTTKLTEAKRRQAQKEAAEAAGDAPAPVPTKPASKPARSSSAGIPPEAAQKLNELYASAALYRQKIATIQARPPGQQAGLEMTQKLLKSVEDQIADLEKKYAG